MKIIQTCHPHGITIREKVEKSWGNSLKCNHWTLAGTTLINVFSLTVWLLVPKKKRRPCSRQLVNGCVVTVFLGEFMFPSNSKKPLKGTFRYLVFGVPRDCTSCFPWSSRDLRSCVSDSRWRQRDCLSDSPKTLQNLYLYSHLDFPSGGRSGESESRS